MCAYCGGAGIEDPNETYIGQTTVQGNGQSVRKRLWAELPRISYTGIGVMEINKV